MFYYLSVITVPLQPAPADSFTAEEKAMVPANNSIFRIGGMVVMVSLAGPP